MILKRIGCSEMRGYPFGSAYLSDGSVVLAKSWFSPAAGRSALNFAAAHGVNGISVTGGNPPASRSPRGRTHEPERFGCAGAAGAAAGLEQAAAANSAAAVDTARRW